MSAPLPALTRWFAASGGFWWAVLLVVLCGAGLFAVVVVAGSALSSHAQQGPATLAIALLCIPMGWEWLWHSLAPRLGVDLIDLLHGWWAHLVLAGLGVFCLLGPWLLSAVADKMTKAREKIRADLASAGPDLAEALAQAEKQERAARQDAWSTFWAAVFLATIVLAPLLGVLGYVAEWLADDPGPPHTFPLQAPRALWPRTPGNAPIPEGDAGGPVDAFVPQYNHARAWYFVLLRRGERLRLGSVDAGLHVTLQAREMSPFYRVEWTWEDVDEAFVAPCTGWYRVKVQSDSGRSGRIQWFIE